MPPTILYLYNAINGLRPFKQDAAGVSGVDARADSDAAAAAAAAAIMRDEICVVTRNSLLVSAGGRSFRDVSVMYEALMARQAQAQQQEALASGSGGRGGAGGKTAVPADSSAASAAVSALAAAAKRGFLMAGRHIVFLSFIYLAVHDVSAFYLWYFRRAGAAEVAERSAYHHRPGGDVFAYHDP